MQPNRRRSDRVGGYLSFAEDQSQYYKRQLADVEALLVRDVLPFIQQHGAPTSSANASSGSPFYADALGRLALVRALLKDLHGVCYDAHAVITTMDRDLRLVAAWDEGHYLHQQNGGCLDGDGGIGSTTLGHLHALLAATKAHLVTVSQGAPVGPGALREAMDGLRSVALRIPSAHHKAIRSYVMREEAKAMGRVLLRAVRQEAEGEGSEKPRLMVQLQAEVAANAHAMRLAEGRIAAVEVSLAQLDGDHARLAGDIALLAAAKEHVRSRCEAQLAAIDDGYGEGCRVLSEEASLRVEEAVAGLGQAQEALGSVEGERAHYAEAHARLAFGLHEASAQLRAELRQLEYQIRHVGRYGSLRMSE